jgi:tetrahydromethanopterin S-methyltransferase subunit B
MNKLLEAFVYFMENGLGEKLSKELAEKLTGLKAPKGKIEIPKTKGPDEFQMPKAKDDVIEASDNVSGNYAAGDTKYNADVLAEELARKRGFIEDDGIQDATDMSQVEYSKLYSEAYEFLTNLNRLNKPVKRTPNVKTLATRKMRGDLPFINTRLSNPMTNKMVLRGLDGTTESLYSQFRIELEAYKNGLENNLKTIKENNIALSSKDKDNILYNIKIVNNLNNKVDQLADDLVQADKSPEKIYQDFRNVQLEKRFGITRKDIAEQLDKDQGILASMDESMAKIKKLIDETEDIRSGKAEIDNKTRVKNLYQGKGYGPNEGLNRSLTRQFLRDEIESGRIETTQAIYNAMKEGSHPFIDAIKVFRHHYGDDAFDKIGKYIDENAFSDSGIRYPGRFEFRKMGLVPLNKKAPGKTYAHYSLPGEIDQEIADIDKVIKTIEEGNNPFFKTKEDIKNQNSKRSSLVKIRNEIAPEDTKQLPGDELLETAEVVPIKEEGILTGVDNTAEKLKKLEGKTFKGVELYGDETFDELKYIDENAESLNGVHPRDMDPKEGFARGGIVEVLI